MKQKQIITILSIVFLITIIYFLGSNITGYLLQTMYCEDGVCHEICRYQADCENPEEICCAQDNFAICKESNLCEQEYTYQPVEQDTSTLQQSPSTLNTIIYIILTIAVIATIIFYYKRKTKA